MNANGGQNVDGLAVSFEGIYSNSILSILYGEASSYL